MNDDARFERLFADGLHEIAPQRAPDRLRTKVKAESGDTPPRRRWLALIKETPMRTNSRLAVGSPTMRVAAIMAATLMATLLVISAGVAGSRIFAADGAIVVDQSGGGNYTTITEAVAAAEDGDEILVRPGSYVEAVVIEADITVRGDGPREDIVISAPDDGPVHDTGFSWLMPAPYAVLLADSHGKLSDLTLEGTNARLFVDGGSPTVEGLLLQEVGLAYAGSAVTGAVVVKGGASPVFTDNLLVGGGGLSAYEDSDPVFDSNVLDGSGAIGGDFGTDAVIKDNTIIGEGRQGVTFLGATSATVTGNTISGKAYGITVGDGISVSGGSDGPQFEPVIENNSITGATQIGIQLNGGSPTVAGNVVVDGRTGILLQFVDGTVSDNDVRGNEVGVLAFGGAPTLADNSITGNGMGLSLAGDIAATLTGNVICDNEINLRVADGTDVTTDGNEICEDAPAE